MNDYYYYLSDDGWCYNCEKNVFSAMTTGHDQVVHHESTISVISSIDTHRRKILLHSVY